MVEGPKHIYSTIQMQLFWLSSVEPLAESYTPYLTGLFLISLTRQVLISCIFLLIFGAA